MRQQADNPPLSQVDLLKEILNLQADMVVMLLSMLEGESGRHMLTKY